MIQAVLTALVQIYVYPVRHHTISSIIHVSNARTIVKHAQIQLYAWNAKRDFTQTK